MRIDVIIPFHNIYASRGIKRLLWSVHSISQQTKKVNKIWVVCSSKKAEAEKVQHLLVRYDIEFLYLPDNKLNICKLFNAAILRSDADYIQILGCDFIMRKDYLKSVSNNARERRLIIKRVKMLDKKTSDSIGFKTVNYWKFPDAPYNEYGDYANGIICASRQWFLDNLYDERFELLGAMDNLQVMKAEKELSVIWMEESEILHIWHKISQLKGHKQFEKNQQYLREYVKH